MVPFIHRPTGQRVSLFTILAVGTVFPSIAPSITDFLSGIALLIIGGGVYMLNRDRPRTVSTWIALNGLSFYVLIFTGHGLGIIIPPWAIIASLVAITVYDLIGVSTGTMQTTSIKLLTHHIPVVLLIPNTPTFDYDKFTTILETEGFKGLHETDHGAMLFGVGDAVAPAGLGLSLTTVGTHLTSTSIVTIPQATTLVGGIVGFALLLWRAVPRPLPALTVVTPTTCLGLVCGLVIDPNASLSVLL